MLADETDFLDLYGKLRLEPDCSLADFKQAYRRHVSQWHPDRRSRGNRADALAARRLQRLMKQYSAAMAFHREHGRLPGAAKATVTPLKPLTITTPPCRSALARDGEAPETEPDAPSFEAVIETPAPPIASRPAPTKTRRVMWLAGIVAMGALVWTVVPDPDRVEPSTDGVPVVTAEGEAPLVTTGTLSVGMKDDDVVALEGEPTLRGPDRWEYGPSWVRFEGGSVVDWYSSPLRTLHVRSSHAER